MKTFEMIGLFMVISGLYIGYHLYVAPEMDEQGRITKPGKKLNDLWRRKK